ncbi:MAG: helix-turn-helix domain-containing protein [Natronincolaceae bacterium]
MGNARIKHVGSKFTIVPNQIMDDPTISFRAKGVYAYLRSKPDNWEYRVQNITRAGKEGRDAIQTAIKELESAGYIERVANQVEGGKYNGWIWYVYETPINRDTDRLPENPSVGFPVRRFSRPSVFQGDYNNTIFTNTIYNKNVNNNNDAVQNDAVQTVIDIFRQEGIHISAKTVQDISLLLELPEEKIKHIASVLGDRKRKGKVKNPAGLLRNNPEVISAILDGTFYPDVPKPKHGTSPKNTEGDIYCPQEKTEKWMIFSHSPEKD